MHKSGLSFLKETNQRTVRKDSEKAKIESLQTQKNQSKLKGFIESLKKGLEREQEESTFVDVSKSSTNKEKIINESYSSENKSLNKSSHERSISVASVKTFPEPSNEVDENTKNDEIINQTRAITRQQGL